jgi:hypothetical protein
MEVKDGRSVRLTSSVSVSLLYKIYGSPQATTSGYRDSFTCLYVDDVRTSQEAHRPPMPVTGIALHVYM